MIRNAYILGAAGSLGKKYSAVKTLVILSNIDIIEDEESVLDFSSIETLSVLSNIDIIEIEEL